MALFIRKFSNLEDAQVILQGGLIGGEDLTRKSLYLHDLTIVFAAPYSGTITFVASENGSPIPAGDGLQVPLSIFEVLTQINAGSSGDIIARLSHGRLVLIDSSDPPTTALSITSGTALPLLGFEDIAQVGTFYKPPNSTAPRLLSVEPLGSGIDGYVLVTEET